MVLALPGGLRGLGTDEAAVRVGRAAKVRVLRRVAARGSARAVMGRASQIFWYLSAPEIPSGTDRAAMFTKIDPESTELKALRRAFLRSKRALGDRKARVEILPGQSLEGHWDGEPFCEACEGRTDPGRFTQINLFGVPAPCHTAQG